MNRTTPNLILFSMLLIVSSCNISPKKAPADTSQIPRGESTAPELNPSKVNAFSKLEQQAIRACDSEQIVLCKQLIAKGIKKTQAAGRQYDLFEARFSLLQGTVEQRQNNSIDARRHFADAMAIFRIRKNPQGTFEVHLAQAALEENTGNFSAAQREIDEAQKLLPKVADQNLRGLFITQQAALLVSQMNHKEAAKLFLEAAELFRSLNNKKREADAFVQLAACEEAMEKIRESKNSLEKAYKIYIAEDDKEGAVVALHKLALFSVQEEKFKKAREQLKRVEGLYIELDRQSDATKVNQHLSALPE